MIDLSGLIPIIQYNKPLIPKSLAVETKYELQSREGWFLYFIRPESLDNPHLQKGNIGLMYSSLFTVKLHDIFKKHPYWQVGFLDKIEKNQTIHPYKGLCIKCRDTNPEDVNFGIIGIDTKGDAMLMKLKYPAYDILYISKRKFRGE
jgi:hypothetical protein